MAESDGLTPREAAAQIGELVADLCDEQRRADLASSVRALLDQLASPARVIVTGEFKQGKSSLVNALCGQPVCPVDDDVATAIPTIVRYEPEPTAAAIFTSETADLTERKALEFEDLPAWIREDGQQVAVPGLTAVDVALPSTLLRSGLTLIDMPGTGGMATPQAAMALAAVLPTCDAAVVVSDAGQPVTASEAEHVETIRNRLDAVLVTKTKIDIHRTWEVVVALDDQTFRALDVPVIGISAELARRAWASQDRELAVESRLPEVSVWLQRVAGETRDRTALGVVTAALEACAHVAAPLEQEAAALRDPSGHAERAAQLEAATAEATRLRSAASRWQQVLSDTMGDISTDLGDDLRSRFRGLITAAEEALDQADPATTWVEFEPELRRLITTAASDYQLAVHDRLVACARRVEAVFSEEEAAVDDLIPSAAGESPPRGDSPITVKEMKRAGVGARAMGAVRASYSGAVLTGFVTGVLGLTLAAPVALAAGAAVGYRGIREDAKRQLAQRQAMAKAAVRQYADEVVGALSKETRDTVRRTQRSLRDHFTARADEMLRSAAASYDAAKRGAALADQQAADRLAEVSHTLGHVTAIRDLVTKAHDAISAAVDGPPIDGPPA